MMINMTKIIPEYTEQKPHDSRQNIGKYLTFSGIGSLLVIECMK